VVCLGYMSMPTTETLNLDPQVDFKVWMDLQFQHLATAPAFAGLYGLMEYTSGYADEETVRWAARLYRHYGMEGKTDLLSARLGYRYRLDYVQNPDFAEGTQHWQVKAAEPGAVEVKSLKGYAWLQGRYPRTSRGDTFVWLKRSAAGPALLAEACHRRLPGAWAWALGRAAPCPIHFHQWRHVAQGEVLSAADAEQLRPRPGSL